MTDWAKQQPKLKRRVLSPRQQLQHNIKLGRYGELVAVKFLASQGYRVLDCNIRFKTREVDIVAQDKAVIVFCEVKYRKDSTFGDPSLAVSKRKLRNLEAVAQQYIQHTGWSGDYRFDIISVSGKEVRHFKNITWGV